MTSDVNSELQRLALIWQKFKGLVYLPLVPLIGTPIAQMFLRSSMPGTAVIYDGLLGFAGNFITLFLTGLMFHLVANMCKSTPVTDDDRSVFIVNLWEKHPRLRKFIYKISPKNAARRVAIRKQEEALSRKTPELMTIERLMFLFVGLLAGIVLLIIGLNAGRTFLLNSTQNMGIVKDTSLDEYEVERVLELDNAYLDRENEWTEEEFMTNIKNALPGISDLNAGEQMKRLQDKESALRFTELQWWYLLLVYGFALGVSYIPNLLRYMRKWSAQSAAEEDFLQLQSLMAIVMCMGVIVIEAMMPP